MAYGRRLRLVRIEGRLFCLSGYIESAKGKALRGLESFQRKRVKLE